MIASARAVNLARVRCAGRRPYSVRVLDNTQSKIKNVSDLKAWKPERSASQVEVSGWVRSVRKSSGVRFVDITDGSSMRPVQIVVDKAMASELRPGAAVRVKGTWHNGSGTIGSGMPSQTNPVATPESNVARDKSRQGLQEEAGLASAAKLVRNAELHVAEVEILGPSDPLTYPIQNKYQSPESLRTISHLRSRTPLNSTLLRLRSDATALLTQFFFQEGFQQTHPPIITSSDCEGAGEAFSIKGSGKEEFFRDPKYLTVSTQLHLEALAQALGDVWTLSPTFRAEQSDTSRHLSEFYMLEAEMSFLRDMDQVMDLVQKMLNFLAHGLRQRSAANESAANELMKNRLDAKDPAERLAFADLVDEEQLQRRWRGLVAAKERWPRITYTEAIAMLKPVANTFEHAPEWGYGLQSEHERYLADKVGYDAASDAYRPIFITQYPRGIKAFYMPQSTVSPSQGSTVDCFDLLVPDLGELAGGSMREHRLAELEDNMLFHGLEVPQGRTAGSGDLNWYLDLRRWGCPPHGGFGLGFDRLLSYLTGVPNVRDIVPFPRYYQRCDC